MVSSSRAWAGMSHQAVVKAVCINKLQLQFPSNAPEALVALGQACMAYDAAERPSFEDILDVLAPLNDAIVSAEMNAIRVGIRSHSSMDGAVQDGIRDEDDSASTSWVMPTPGKVKGS